MSVDTRGCVDARVQKNLLQDLEPTGDLAPKFGFWGRFGSTGISEGLAPKSRLKPKVALLNQNLSSIESSEKPY